MKDRLKIAIALSAAGWAVVQIARVVAFTYLNPCQEVDRRLLPVLWKARSCFAGLGMVAIPEVIVWRFEYAALIVVALAWGWVIASEWDRLPQMSNIAAVAISVLAATFLGNFVYWAGMHQFGGFDYSILVDVAWRIVQGQAPYRDFICPLPPIFYISAAAAFKLWGIRWASLQALAGMFTAITFFWLFAIASRIMGRWSAFLVCVAIEMAAMGLAGIWWYNDVTPIIASIFALSTVALIQALGESKQGFWRSVSWASSLGLLVMAKPNTAAPLVIVGVLAVLFMAWKVGRLVEMLHPLFWSMAVPFFFFWAANVNPLDMLRSYVSAAQSRTVADPFIGWRIISYGDRMRGAIIIAGVGWPLLRLFAGHDWHPNSLAADYAERRGRLLRLLFISFAAISIIAMTTNGEMKESDAPLLICAAALCPLAGIKLLPSADVITRVTRATLIAMICWCAFLGAMRYRTATVGEHEFYEWDQTLRESPWEPFFAGFQGSDTLYRTISQARMAITANPDRYHQEVWFGPRMEFLYAVMLMPSPHPGLPVWWDPNTSFPQSQYPALIERWKSHKFETLIFLRFDATFYNYDFGQAILSDYEPDTRYSCLTVFRRKH